MGLSGREVARLDQLYGEYARVRLEEEGNVARWQARLAQEQGKLPPDLGAVDLLLRSIKGAEERIALAFAQARVGAIQALLPAHRAYLERLPAVAQACRDDKYRQILVGSPATILQVSVDSATARAILADQLRAERAEAIRAAQAYYDNTPRYPVGYGPAGYGTFQPTFTSGYGGVYGGGYSVVYYPSLGVPRYYTFPSIPFYRGFYDVSGW
jgi:hypothetical protein